MKRTPTPALTDLEQLAKPIRQAFAALEIVRLMRPGALKASMIAILEKKLGTLQCQQTMRA